MRETKRDAKKRGMWLFLFIGLLLGSSGGVFLSCKNPGLKYYRNYSIEEYVYQPQNWCIVQDHRGVIYAANQGGVLEYDGVSWNLIKVSNQAVRSLAIDGSGVIYVGGLNELGLLVPDSQGKLEYRSLVKYIDENKKNFGSVWKTHVFKEDIYYRTSKYLFQWNPRQKQMAVVLEAKKDKRYHFSASFNCGNKFFIRHHNIGLMEKVNNTFKLIPGGEKLASVRRFYMLVPRDIVVR